MITIIFGKTGNGKSSLANHFLQEKYEKSGSKIYEACCNSIREINLELNRNLSLPGQVPFYTNFAVKIPVGYNEFFEPYILNPYYFGLNNKNLDVQNIPPGSHVWIDESHKYYDSRESQTMPSWVKQAYAEHRHHKLDITLITPRVMQIDINLRQIASRFIEVRGMENEYGYAGNLTRSTFTCREYSDWEELENALKRRGDVSERTDYEDTSAETHYTHVGNIFNNYSSFIFNKDFLPPEGKDFSYLPHVRTDNNKDYDKYYELTEPKNYRSAA